MANYTAEGVFIPDYTKGDEKKLDVDLLRRKFTARVNNLYNPQLEGGIQIDKRLNIDPRVLYRWVGGDAIKDFDSSGVIRGPELGGYAEDAVKGQQPPFFSQGMPLWQYAGGINAGTGTAKGASSNPYLIATVGADWTSRTGQRNVDETQISRRDFDEYIENDRGLTRPVRDSVDEARIELRQLSKFTDQLIEETNRGPNPTPKQIQGIAQRYQSILDRIKPHERALNKYLHGTEYLDLFDDESPLMSLSQDIGADLGVTQLDFTPEREWLKEKTTDRQLTGFANMLHFRREEMSRLMDDLQATPSSFNLNPTQRRTFLGKDVTSFALPNWLKAMENSTDLAPSDSALFERIKNGTATPQELNAVYGLGRFDYDLNDMGNPLRHLDLRRSGSGAMYHERLPNTRIQPSNASWTEGWEVPSAYLDVKDRPFAVWQYTKNGLRLVNQGNNDPVLGNRPIPTALQDPYLTYEDLATSKARMAPELGNHKSGIGVFGVGANALKLGSHSDPNSVFSLQNVIGESMRGNPSYGRGGFVNVGGLANTSMIRNFANLATPDPVIGAIQYGLKDPVRARQLANAYLNVPEARSAINSTIGNAGGKALTGAMLALAPYDALSRRELNFTDFYDRYRRDPTYEENMGLRIQSGLEPALNFATFGMYDALAETPTYKAQEADFYRANQRRKEIQAGVDYPMVGGQRVERTTR